MLEVKNIPVYCSKFIFCQDTTTVSYVTHKNKNVLLSNFHHDSSIAAVPKNIFDYNKSKCGVDGKIRMMLKGYRPYRAIRRWSCVLFFDLLVMASQVSYVLYCIKYPDEPICRDKKRRNYLYHLGK